MSLDVFVIFFNFTFYAMEQSGISDVENPIHIFFLTFSLYTKNQYWSERVYNHVQYHGWTPNQIWFNGILDDNNPLSSSDGVDTYVVEFYGEDPGGPRPQLDDDRVQIVPLLNWLTTRKYLVLYFSMLM